jgi:hypothetical protein
VSTALWCDTHRQLWIESSLSSPVSKKQEEKGISPISDQIVSLGDGVEKGASKGTTWIGTGFGSQTDVNAYSSSVFQYPCDLQQVT